MNPTNLARMHKQLEVEAKDTKYGEDSESRSTILQAAAAGVSASFGLRYSYQYTAGTASKSRAKK